MTEPTTEAGRRALANVQPDYGGPWLRDIFAIEAEARADALRILAEVRLMLIQDVDPDAVIAYIDEAAR